MENNTPLCAWCEVDDGYLTFEGEAICPNCYDDNIVFQPYEQDYDDWRDEDSAHYSGPDYWQNDAGEWRLG